MLQHVFKPLSLPPRKQKEGYPNNSYKNKSHAKKINNPSTIANA